MSELPSGTVSLLFTDIEGSTQLQHRLGERYHEVVAEHRRLLEQVFAEHHGVVVDRQTESFFVAFPRARYAVAAAAGAQMAVAKNDWPDSVQVKVRMGIHSGDPELAGDRYVGLAVSRAARICASAHGGQILLSSSARALLSDHEQTALRDLGRYRLKDFPAPEPISQLVVDGLPSQFPPPRSEAAPSRRRWLVPAIVGLLAVVAVAIVLVVVLGGSGSISVGPTALAVIDPGTSEVSGTIELGFKSNLIAAGEDFIWVVDATGSTLRKIDPREQRVAGVFPLAVGAGEVPFGLAVGRGAVWVAVLRGDDQVVLELGTDAGDLRKEIPYGVSVAGPNLARLNALTVGGGAVWAIDPAVGGLWRIDSQTGQARKLAEGLDALSLGAGPGAVWVAGSTGVTKIDATTGLELGSTTIGSETVSESSSVALGLGAVWVAPSGGDTLAEIEPGTVSTTATSTVGRGPAGVAVGEGAVWVANSRDGTVSRVGPAGEQATTIAVGATPGGIVAAYGAVWTSPGEPRG